MSSRARMGVWGLMLAFSLPLALHAADAWHTFTDTKGRKMQAKILDVGNDFVLVELKANGKQLPINFDNLSEEDLEFLDGYEAAPSSAGGAVKESAGDDALPDGEPDKNRLYPRTKEEIRDGIREIRKRPRPDGISREVHEATQTLNVYRFLCGVPSEVEPDAGFSKNAEDAALACKANGGLSHGLGRSTDKCNLSSMGDVVRSVPQYIDDAGENNRKVRGHREWCLNPPMGKVGFGSGGDSYSAMWCMDGSGKPVRGIWSYPGRGLFPLEYLHGNAWSLYGAGQPKSVDDLKVEMFRLSKRPEKPLPMSGKIDGREVPVLHVSLGMSGINFEPEMPVKRGIYWIRMKGGGVSEGYLVELY